MKKMLAFIIVFALCTAQIPSFAKENGVKVKIAPYYTEIQGMSVDNRYVEYPLITYKDITYFPMTFDLCTCLGLMCGYDSEKGLFITREYVVNPNEEQKPFGAAAVNSYKTLYDAVIPTYPVYLNGIYINNAKEEYPLLNFKGVTYFPMTWRFAYEELNFNVEWSEKDYSFKLYDDGKSDTPYAYGIDGNIVKLQNQISVYDESINEYGDTRYTLSYQYYSNYDFDTSIQRVYRREDTPKSINGGMPERTDKLVPEILEATVKDKSIYFGDTLLINLENEEVVAAPYVCEYKTGDSSLISLIIQASNAPAPYTVFKEYFFTKDSSGIRQLPWDDRNNFSGIYPDNKGGFYVTTRGFSPVYSGRWSNSFSDVYYYVPGTDVFDCITEKHGELFNSMEALGVNNGKLYFLGMWYDAQKDRYNGGAGTLFGAVNSGYYTLDLETGEIEKLYPYICGETFIGPDGNLYCISNCSRIPKIVNLNTGILIPIE